jgi:hypothetical protein
MAEFLFITPEEITTTTVLGGNVDVDKYLFTIANTQITVIEPMLGSELYDKVKLEAENDTLAGDYLTLYNEFVKPITKNQALAEYIEVSSFMIANGGAFKISPDNAELMDKDDIMLLSQKYSAIADMYVLRFNKWICKNPLTEYKTCQAEVDAQNIQLKGGWYFGM